MRKCISFCGSKWSTRVYFKFPIACDISLKNQRRTIFAVAAIQVVFLCPMILGSSASPWALTACVSRKLWSNGSLEHWKMGQILFWKARKVNQNRINMNKQESLYNYTKGMTKGETNNKQRNNTKRNPMRKPTLCVSVTLSATAGHWKTGWGGSAHFSPPGRASDVSHWSLDLGFSAGSRTLI